MPISISTLQAAASRYSSTYFSKSTSAAQLGHQKTAFLCHSHHDVALAQGLQELLHEHDCNVYLDWQDTAMPDKPDRTTAERIRAKIRDVDWFIFLATPNSMKSRWCPWEIGFADQAKAHAQIFIVATSDDSGTWYGNEYLQLYRRISTTTDECLGAFDVGKTSSGILVKNLK